ncbi:Ig-like domain-containing protein [Candidatus Kuenenia sp.]|uniref:Ig-like domain-containing protein n=1 Tax=Candidatus Kuenenia sp. TaxID=2499824 RepID=UPI00322050D0
MTVLITNRNDNMTKRSKTFFAQSFFYKTLLFFLIFVPFLQSTYAQDSTPPTVSATSPVSNATGVSVDSVITATFTEAMDPATITTATFTVGGVTGTVSYNGTSNTATFTPTANLSYDTFYTATITTGVTDASGNAMLTDYTWNFTTAATGSIGGQQAYYTFDEGTGSTATDSSGNNRNGTITGATWTTGKIGDALNFDGNDYVTIPSMNYDEISVSAWFNKNTSGTNIIFGGFRYNADVQLREGFDLYFNSGTPNRLRFVATTRNTSWARTVKEATKDFTDSNGSWYHVVGTYNKTTGEQKLYVDGQLVDTQTHPSWNVIVPLTDRNYMAIGTRYTDFGFFRGIIDDVQIYNRALSGQEVLSLFNNATTPDTTPPTVSATSPVSNATEVAVNSAITCTFSEAMDASSITTTTFLVSDGSSNIGGAVSYSGTTATFTPSSPSPLVYSTTYTATITTGVTDASGNAMLTDYTWNFTTAATGGIGGQQAYYTFDEGTGSTATDSSGNNRNGTITGATWTTGKIAGALNFDGNDYVTIPRMNYDEISVSAWFNKNTSGTNVIFGGFRYNANVQLREGFDLYFSSGTPNILRFVAATSNTSGTRTVKDATKDFTDSNGSWYHVVGTYNKTTGEQKLYVDGQLVDTQTHPSGNVIVPLTDRNYMAIGTRYTDFGFFRGIIDDVQIYNRALSGQEVLSLFNNATTPDTTPPTVSATSPVSNATEVAVNSAITCTFSEAMDASSITTTTFLVSDGSSNIGGAVSYSGTTATFTPSSPSPLVYSTTYTATITTGVTDASGNAMLTDYTWNFTTAATGGIGGQQAYYTFDEGTGSTATDSSGNNRNGTITGATWTTGKIAGALNFDGNDYVTIPRMNYDEISVSAWFNKNTSGTNVIFGGFRYNANVQLREGFDLYFSSGTPNILRFVAATSNTSGTRTVKDATKDFTDSNGSWYHVVGTYNKTTGEQKLYVDGQLVDTQTHPSGNVIVPLTDRNYMAIGTRYTDFGFFRGIIDDIRIYNRALSAQEVLSLFNNATTPDTTLPTVSATSPVSNATEVAVNSTITCTFSEAMDASSITTATFLVSDGISNIGGWVSYSGTTATFTPSGNLSSSTTYTATITTGVTDASGNGMTANYTWNFTTGLSEDPGGQQVHYAFDEGTGAIATDSSGHNKNGTITGFTGSTWTTTGKFGRALSFNGESTYVSIPPLNYDEISVSAWFYRYSVDTAGEDVIFGGWSWVNLQGYGLYFNQYSASRNTIRFIVTSKTSEGTKTQKHATKDLSTSTGKWYHVTGTYNKTTGEQKLYVDGQLVNTQTHPAGNTIVPYTAASYMAIGALTSNYGHMDGKIDEVRVYNRALSAGEVLSLRFYNTTTPDTTPLVRITTPDNYYLQENSDLSVQAETNNLQQKQGILFVLDSGTAYEQSISDYTAPYEVVFTNLSQGEYVMDAFVVDAEGNKISGEYAHDKRVQIGIGDYYWGMGDSITKGVGDDDVSDNTSQDGRNEGGGYTPVLNDLLTAEKGTPHTVFNEGVGGATSSDGSSSINRMLLRHPNASWCLVQYGTNDANPFGLPIPSGLGLNPGDPGYPGTFKNNMQKILDAINAAGQKACLAKAPIALGDSSGTYQDPDQAPRNILIKEYNQVVDELKSNFSNNILIIPPDFYSYFNYLDASTERRRYEDEYADTLHPNGIGYRSMSNLWFQALTQ